MRTHMDPTGLAESRTTSNDRATGVAAMSDVESELGSSELQTRETL